VTGFSSRAIYWPNPERGENKEHRHLTGVYEPQRYANPNNRMSWSSVVVGGRVILQRDGDSPDSEVLALDVKTGQTAWSTKRPGFSSAWSTPMIWAHDQQTELILNGTPAVGRTMTIQTD
jgi:outer membrane protein assembly factor BamB